MRVLDVSYAEPERNLALDEVLLNAAEAGRSGEVLRFWESPVPFVVLGLTQVLADEAHEANCADAGVPILRRCSAGGCVLQGPGSLNFTLILDQEIRPDIGTIRSSYRHILGRVSKALSREGVVVEAGGISDLVMGGRKVSGNAQRRRKRFILHHGTLLHGLNGDMMGRCLREPVQRPEYRGERRHADFVDILPLDGMRLRHLLTTEFEAASGSGLLPEESSAAVELGESKYLASHWVQRR